MTLHIGQANSNRLSKYFASFWTQNITYYLYDASEKQAGSQDNDVSTLSIALIKEKKRLPTTTAINVGK